MSIRWCSEACGRAMRSAVAIRGRNGRTASSTNGWSTAIARAGASGRAPLCAPPPSSSRRQLDWIETMAEESLFVRLGGEAGVARVLDRHYERVMEDDHLREYFLDVDIGRLKTAQLAFLGAVFGEPGASYDGATLRVAPRDQLVSELAFDSLSTV